MTGDQKTMLRGGTGLDYSQVFLNVTFYVEQTNHVRLLTLNFPNTNNDPNFANRIRCRGRPSTTSRT